MAAKKKTTSKKRSVAAVRSDAGPTIQYLVVLFTFLSIVYVAMAYWRYA